MQNLPATTTETTNGIQLFSYGENPVRIIKKDNEFWFVAKDVCDILELADVTSALRTLDNDEKMTLQNEQSHSGQRGGAQFINVINESGVYTLVMRSNKSEARRFRKWVTSEVLPTLI
ncbi:MAG: Bro-N domain-containing protein, partial [Synergistaceae bacterium]|nr:Bro-N domain-containing protein [Synergistaceae bacterium]